MLKKKKSQSSPPPTLATSWAPGFTENPNKSRGHYDFDAAHVGTVVEVVIPTILTSDLLPYVIELFRLQVGNVRPHFVIIDTGSHPEEQEKVAALRAPDVEVHLLGSAGYQHSSDPVAVALDLALSICRTEKQVLTHADCFPMRRDALESLLGQVGPHEPCAGYQITPRPGIKDWEKMIGHTWAALDVGTIRRLGISWGYGASIDRGALPLHGRWDTEYGFCNQLWQAGYDPLLLGTEENYARNINEDFDHTRSLPSARLYQSVPHLAQAEEWIALAVEDAKERITLWKNSSPT